MDSLPNQCPTCAQRFRRVLRPRSLLLYNTLFIVLWVVLWFYFSMIALVFVAIGEVLITVVLD
jgi:hypothetical protein